MPGRGGREHWEQLRGPGARNSGGGSVICSGGSSPAGPVGDEEGGREREGGGGEMGPLARSMALAIL